jgi:hypothetical protein
MEEKTGTDKVWRMAAASTTGRMAARKVGPVAPAAAETVSPEVERENIVTEMVRIFKGLLGCTSKRTGVNLATIKTAKTVAKTIAAKPENGTQRKLEQEIYRLIKGLVERDSPNTGFALNMLFNNGMHYYDKANVPLSFGTFLTSLVTFLEGHDCLSICPDEMAKVKTLLSRG